MKKLLKEFNNFAMKGNVIDLAVGFVIGSAFGKIVTSLVSDIIMPFLGLIIGKVNFSSLKIVIVKAADGKDELAVNIGNFIQSLIDFFIIAFSIFLVIKAVNELRKRFERQPEATLPAAPKATRSEELLEEIRDIMKSGPSR